MIHFIKLFLIALPVFTTLDLLWLGLLMRSFYESELGILGRKINGTFSPNFFAATIVYLVLVGGLIIFVFPRINPYQSPFVHFLWGALYGFVVYAVYECTNYAIITGWPIKLVFVDTAWGMVLFGLTTMITFLIARFFKMA